jgi:hypothetical protein
MCCCPDLELWLMQAIECVTREEMEEKVQQGLKVADSDTARQRLVGRELQASVQQASGW